jgi:hypothetical protein
VRTSPSKATCNAIHKTQILDFGAFSDLTYRVCTSVTIPRGVVVRVTFRTLVSNFIVVVVAVPTLVRLVVVFLVAIVVPAFQKVIRV